MGFVYNTKTGAWGDTRLDQDYYKRQKQFSESEYGKLYNARNFYIGRTGKIAFRRSHDCVVATGEKQVFNAEGMPLFVVPQNAVIARWAYRNDSRNPAPEGTFWYRTDVESDGPYSAKLVTTSQTIVVKHAFHAWKQDRTIQPGETIELQPLMEVDHDDEDGVELRMQGGVDPKWINSKKIRIKLNW